MSGNLRGARGTGAECAGTLGALLRRQSCERGDVTAFVCAERRTSYAELDARTDRVAAALARDGIGPGDRIAFLGRDSEHAYEVVLGAAKLGAVTLGVNWRLAPPEIEFVLRDAGAKLLLADDEFAGRAAGAEVRTLSTEREYAGWRDAANPAAPRVDATEDDVVVQMYTSGTTGRPKGVMLAHRSFFAVMRALRRAGDPWVGWSGDDVSLLVIPSFHIGGLWWAMTGLVAGATNVVLPAFDARATVAAIERHRVTKVCLVPAMIRMVLSEPSLATADVSSLGCVVYGGSPIPRTTLVEAQERLRCDFAQIYGLTETGNTAVCLRPEEHADPESELLLAAGRPYPEVEVKIVDDDGATLPPRAVGEIWIRSPANMTGYWNRPEATAETLRDGWVVTGDAGYLDETGHVYVCDRKKDMILYAGENVYPAEIEAVLVAHDGVAEAAVIGVPDERWGELVKALVVLEPGARPTKRELLAHCREGLADFKVPKSIDFVDTLPRTPSGKLKKAELRAPYWEGRERKVN
ncbi:MAG: long-chain-fatty-acid--CoA ligase [Planctomycetota bacterium]